MIAAAGQKKRLQILAVRVTMSSRVGTYAQLLT
jgi:hypothetical protein